VETTLTWTYDQATEWFDIWIGDPVNGVVIVDSWFSASDLSCNTVCSLPTNGYVNGDYQWWIQGWSSITAYGSWANGAFTVAIP